MDYIPLTLWIRKPVDGTGTRMTDLNGPPATTPITYIRGTHIWAL